MYKLILYFVCNILCIRRMIFQVYQTIEIFKSEIQMHNWNAYANVVLAKFAAGALAFLVNFTFIDLFTFESNYTNFRTQFSRIRLSFRILALIHYLFNAVIFGVFGYANATDTIVDDVFDIAVAEGGWMCIGMIFFMPSKIRFSIKFHILVLDPQKEHARLEVTK